MHNEHHEISTDVIKLDVIGNEILDEHRQEQVPIYPGLFDPPDEA